MFATNDTITLIRHASQGRKRDFLRNERTVFGTVKKTAHPSGPENNEYFQTEVSIPCFTDFKTVYNFFNGEKRRDGQLEYFPPANVTEIAAGDIIQISSQPKNTYRVVDVDHDPGMFGDNVMNRLTLLRTTERTA